MLTDSHCHIHMLPDYPACIKTTLAAAKANDLKWLLNVGTTLADMQELRKLAEYEPVYISAGVHPNEDPGVVYPEKVLIEAALSHPKLIAIGETGLDYYRQDSENQDLSWQRERFVTHIHVAKQVNKPLIIHSRHARKDTIDVLRAEKANEISGVMHCFTEDWDMAQKAMDLGFYISFSGIVTFKNAVELQEVAKKVPLDRMLIETDCPYLAPVPFRGKPNQPAYVKHTAEFIAQLRGESFEHIAQMTTQNFRSLFFRNQVF